MKAIYKSLIASVAMLPMLTSCVEEVFPSNAVTEEQLNSSAKATESLVWGMSAFTNHFATVSDSQAYDWGLGSIMHIRDVMTEDMAIISNSYDWYSGWEQCQSIGEDMMRTQFIWNFYTQLVLTSNNTIGAINPETASPQQLGYLGMGYAFRAMAYLDMARMYEFLDNEVTEPYSPEGNFVGGLTVPIMTDETTEEESRDNPRVPHAEMFNFILSDLQKAEGYIVEGTRSSKTMPDIAVVYGLFARLYMWNLDYPQAAEYARKAINNFAGYPTTKEQWLNTSSGFNDLNTPSWMWGSQCMKEDDVVQTGILNWTSWVSNEAEYGYSAAGPFVMIGASVYNRMSNDDFRKLSYIAPEGSPLSGEEPVIDPEFAATFPTYASLKFRPGEGNTQDYNVGSATAYPLMRVEEMYFIEAEATAHTSPGQGAQLLNTFMQTYRYPTYSCSASGVDDVVEEIVFQKRVELWGEGQSYFDFKRLNYSVTRVYEGSNFYNGCNYNTNGRPAWMNFCIVQTEANNNAGVRGYNNPNPSGLYKPAM